MKTVRAAAAFAAFAFLFLPAAFAAAPRDADALYKETQAALESGRGRRADFYAARCLGAAVKSGAAGFRERVDALYGPKLAPTGFLSSAYDPGFVMWFRDAMLPLWDQADDRVREKHASVEVRHVRQGDRFAVVVAYPKIEAWFTSGETLSDSKPLVLAVGSSAKGRRVTLIAGRYVDGRAVSLKPVEINDQSHALQYVWEPFFEDLDGDGVPELWLRYDLTWGNGFVQFLDVYRTGEEELVLVRRFEGKDEGVARRVAPGRVETARGFGKGGLSHFEYDSHRVETWEFKNGDFVRTGVREIPHLLRSDAWKAVFADASGNS